MMARVLFLTRWYPLESKPAKGLFVREHARAASLGNEVTVLHLAGPDPTLKSWWSFEELNDPRLTLGLPTFRVWYRQPRLRGTEYARFLLSGMRAVRQLKARVGGWDLIHAHEFDAAFLAILLKGMRGVPVVATEHSTHFPRNLLRHRAIWRARFAFRRCAFVLPVSQALERAIAGYRIPARFVVVPNTVDLELFRPVPSIDSGRGSNRGRKQLTVVSRLTDVKGIPILLDACAHLARMRRDWRLDIIGDGPGRRSYEERVNALGLEDWVRFRGLQSRAEVARFLQRAHLHVVPSNQETFCVAAVEALACGTPVVATRSGGPEEFVRPDVGRLVEPGDPAALASAIAQALESSFPPRDVISRVARDRFSHEAVGAALSDLYEEALRSQGLRRRARADVATPLAARGRR